MPSVLFCLLIVFACHKSQLDIKKKLPYIARTDIEDEELKSRQGCIRLDLSIYSDR